MSFISDIFASHNNNTAGKHTAIPQENLGPQLGSFSQANLGPGAGQLGGAGVGHQAGLDLSNYGSTIGAVQGQAAGRGGPAQDTIARQGMLADQLQAASQGRGPNPALDQLRQTTAQNVNAAAGAAASARGINPALAARMGVDAAGALNQQAAGQAATLNAQQQIAARDQLNAALQARGGTQLGQQAAGVGAMGTAGGLQNAQNANQISNVLGAQGLGLQDYLGTQGINTQRSLGQQGLALQNTLGTGALNLQGSLGQQGLNLKNWSDAENRNVQADAINAGVGQGNAQANNAITGGILNGVGAAISDERAKADVHRLQTDALPGVPEATFRYKNEPAGTQHRGVIAQDVEKVRPDLVGHAGGLRTVPAGLMKYARGGVVDGAEGGSPVAQPMRPAAPAQAPRPMGLPQNGSMYSAGPARGGMTALQSPAASPARSFAAPAQHPQGMQAPAAGPSGSGWAGMLGSAMGSAAPAAPPAQSGGMFGGLGSAMGGGAPASPQFGGLMSSMLGGNPAASTPQPGNVSTPLLSGFAEGGAVDEPAGGDPLQTYLSVLHSGDPAGGKGGGPSSQGIASLLGDAGGAGMFANGGRVPAMVSPDEVVVPPSMAKNPTAAGSMVASGTGKVPGKAKVGGDSPKNDTVRANLQAGSVVIPRSITQGPNPGEHAASFVASVMRRSGGSQKMHQGGFIKEQSGPGPGAHADYSEGGYVEADPGAKLRPPKTARGAGRSETRSRIKSASAPKGEE